MRSHGDDYLNIDVARVNRASALVKLGRFVEAEPVFRVLSARRGWGSAREGLANVLVAANQVDDAIAELRDGRGGIPSAAIGSYASVSPMPSVSSSAR